MAACWWLWGVSATAVLVLLLVYGVPSASAQENKGHQFMLYCTLILQPTYSAGSESFQNWLKNGMVLCELINGLHPEGQAPVKKIQASTMALKQMEQISQFLQAAKRYSTNSTEIFQTLDPWEGKNMARVQQMLMNLGGLAVARDDGLFSGDPNWFLKKFKENPQNFLDNQLQEGKNVIGLQMGTN